MRLLCMALLLSSVGAAVAADLTWEPAPRADDFVNSIGVCTHWNYGDRPYGFAYEKVKQRLGQSGIRHVRDGYHPREVELWREFGIRSTVLAEPQRQTLDEQMGIWTANPDMIGMIEGPNEPNLFWTRNNVHYAGETWPKALQLWQKDLYKAVRAEPKLAGIPVTSPTPIFDGPFQAAPITSFDYLALHPYAGGGLPSDSVTWGGQTLRGAIALLGYDAEMKPLIATECGYHYALGSNRVLAGVQGGISETAGGRYFPRLFAEYWKAGFVRTFTYEFIDEGTNQDDPEANFGMLHNDTTPKPAYTAVSNLISILSESHWDPAALRWVGASSPDRAFQFAVDGPATVHHVALSRADGSIDLLLWNEVSSFDLKTKTDLNPGPVRVTVHLASRVPAELYRPLAGTAVQRQWRASAAISLSVPDEVVILRLKTPALQGVIPPPPANLTASTTPLSATIDWRSGGRVAYVVTRLGRYLGTVAPGRDASFTDSNLTPGLGFPYEVRAVGINGLLSPPATVLARTPNERPDLVIRSITWTPAHPKAGDEVRFTVTIANIGSAPTPPVVHGVAIRVDGQMACWSDTSKAPLAPGAKRALVSNNGPAKKPTWTCTAGMHQVEAVVDDVNRIDETTKDNNHFGPVGMVVK